MAEGQKNNAADNVFLVTTICMLCLKLTLSLLLLTSLAIAQPAQLHFNTTDSTIVSGKIKGYKNGQPEKFIDIFLHDIGGYTKKTIAPIDDKGTFTFKFLQPSAGDFGLRYGVNFVMIYANPGESIQVEIDNAEAQQLFHFSAAFKISGKSASTTYHIQKFFEQYYPLAYERNKAIDWKIPYEQLAKHFHNNLRSDLDLLDNYIAAQQPPANFTNWARHYLTYQAAHFIVTRPFSEKANITITVADLVRLLGDIRVQNDSAMITSSYLNYLAGMTRSLQFIVSYKTPYKPGLDPSVSAVALGLDLLDSCFTGLARELAYYNVYRIHASQLTDFSYANAIGYRFDRTIREPLLQNMMETLKAERLTLSFKRFNVLDRVRKFQSNDFVKNDLLATLEKQKGRYIYIDFWGAWCKPCMAEMPDYKALIDAARDLPVTFLFLSVETTGEEMIAVKDKYNIQGLFVNLDKNETDIANEVFEFNGYPTHFLVDPDGNVIAKPVFRGVHTIDQLKRLIK